MVLATVLVLVGWVLSSCVCPGRMMSAGSGRHKPMRTPQIHRPEQLLMSPSFGGGFMSPAPHAPPPPPPPLQNGHRDLMSPQPPPLLHFDGPFSPVRPPLDFASPELCFRHSHSQLPVAEGVRRIFNRMGINCPDILMKCIAGG